MTARPPQTPTPGTDLVTTVRVARELRAKYEEMLRLRLAHAAGDPGDPRRAMAALAARFPGALREIDDLPLPEIRARIDALHAAESGGRLAPWMRAMALFHAFTRGALRAKRWLAGRKHVDASLRAAFAEEVTPLDPEGDALAWADDLARVASPPGGRVTDLVYERIGAHMGIQAREARILVFGLTRREIRATTVGRA